MPQRSVRWLALSGFLTLGACGQLLGVDDYRVAAGDGGASGSENDPSGGGGIEAVGTLGGGAGIENGVAAQAGAGGGAVVCEPRDPEPGCGTGQRCLPAESRSGALACTDDVGTSESYRYCTTQGDCAPSYFCERVTPSETIRGTLYPDSPMCLLWCRVGHDEDCPESREECRALEAPRWVGEQEYGVCAPNPGTGSNDNAAPDAWVCPDSWWGYEGYCDCGCGAFDPDCAAEVLSQVNCNCGSADDVEGESSCAHDYDYECDGTIDPDNIAHCQ